MQRYFQCVFQGHPNKNNNKFNVIFHNVYLSSGNETPILRDSNTVQRLWHSMRHHEMGLSARIHIVNHRNIASHVNTIPILDAGSQPIGILCRQANDFFQNQL